MDRQLVFELPNDLRCIEEAVEFVVSRCHDCEELERGLCFNLRVCLCEALSNAMIYGNGRDPAKRVLLEVELQPGSLVARITDEGRGFDPNAVPDPTVPCNLQRVGGRGLFLMRHLVDEIQFNERGNQVTLVLRLPTSGSFPREASA